MASVVNLENKRYLVKVGLNYRAHGKLVRREPGEICDDIPTISLPWLIKQGLIDEVGNAQAGEEG